MKKVFSVLLLLIVIVTISTTAFARDTAFPSSIFITELESEYLITASNINSLTDKVYTGTEDNKTYIDYDSSRAGFVVPITSDPIVMEVTDKGSITISKPEFELEYPGQSGKWYNDKAKCYANLKTETSPICSVAVQNNTPIEYGCSSEDVFTVSDIQLYSNGTYNFGFKYSVAVKDIDQKVNVYCLKQCIIKCFDLTEPSISWKYKEETQKLTPGVESTILITAIDNESGMQDVIVKNLETGSLRSLEAPYSFKVNGNAQILITAYNNAESESRCTVNVNWYIVREDENEPINSGSIPSKPGDIVTPDKPSEGSGGTSSGETTSNKNNVKLYNNTNSNSSGSKVNSAWDKYWDSKPSKLESTNNVAMPAEKVDKPKAPASPKGYTYVYRETGEEATQEEVQQEIARCLGALKESGIEVEEEDLAITTAVTLVSDEELSKDSNLPISSIIFIVVVWIVCIGGLGFLMWKLFKKLKGI